MARTNYDPEALKQKAELWRLEAAAATMEAVRAFCLDEAAKCEQRAQRSLSTPVLSDIPKSAPVPPPATK
ncbi:MAG: hypothetical protein P4L90_24125 [Rhodopila sp.]|nr:hypothetical protein [Rhodopila sp.]